MKRKKRVELDCRTINMAAATDKARFFLEQSVPELKEYEKKKIFNKVGFVRWLEFKVLGERTTDDIQEEITAIVKKRSDFEHKLNARGAQPVDFVRYAQYEMNLDLLRRKRVRRTGVRGAGFSGQRRIFFILDRATRKFHGDIGLWVQYIDYARQQKAYKKLGSVITDALRLHPTNAELWIYAAQYALDDHADMTQSRSYMQRGLRFCKSSKKLWVHYGKLELIYIAKLVARRRILGLGEESLPTPMEEETEVHDPEADVIALPKVTGEDVMPTDGDKDKDGVDNVALQNLASTPALSGAIPLAIFDSAMKHFANDDRFAHEYYTMVEGFQEVPCLRTILEHVVEVMRQTKPASFRTHICYAKVPIAGLSVNSPDFPRALGVSLARLREHGPDRDLAQEVVTWLQPLLKTEDIDPALQKVLAATVSTAERT